jgi:hypothetical protein
MKRPQRLSVVGIFCLAAGAGGYVRAASASHEEFICTRGAVSRIVSIFNQDASTGNRGCRVDYQKGGEIKTVWSSKNDYKYCVAKAVSLVTKLTEGNFSCELKNREQPDEADRPPENGATRPSSAH